MTDARPSRSSGSDRTAYQQIKGKVLQPKVLEFGLLSNVTCARTHSVTVLVCVEQRQLKLVPRYLGSIRY